MNLQDTIQLLQVKSPKATESKNEKPSQRSSLVIASNDPKLSEKSSKVYDGETDKELEEQIQKVREEFFGPAIHRVNLQRSKEAQQTNNSKNNPTKEEKVKLARLKYACSKPAPVYEFSHGRLQATQPLIYSDYFDLLISGHDVSSAFRESQFCRTSRGTGN